MIMLGLACRFIVFVSILVVIFSWHVPIRKESYRLTSRGLLQGQSRSFRDRLMRLHNDITPETTPPSSLKAKLTVNMKEAMKSKQKNRLSAIRSIQNAIKQKEIDEQIVVNDEMALAILAKLVKQRKESIASYEAAGRQDLVDSEKEELDVINSFLPKQMSVEEIEVLVVETITKLNATSIKDMGKVVAELRPKVAGKADIVEVSLIIKKKLGGK